MVRVLLARTENRQGEKGQSCPEMTREKVLLVRSVGREEEGKMWRVVAGWRRSSRIHQTILKQGGVDERCALLGRGLRKVAGFW